MNPTRPLACHVAPLLLAAGLLAANAFAGWTRSQKLTSVVIASPHNSKLKFAADAAHYVQYLRGHEALPDIIAVENYEPKPAADYPNYAGERAELRDEL